MRLDRLEIKDVLRFRGALDLNFRTLDPGVIAIVGKNGHGKTSLIEVPPGTVYRVLPSRRKDGVDPVQYATSREAWLAMEWTAEDGTAYRAQVNLDGQTRKSDAVLSARVGDKWASLSDGKVSTYKAAIAELFPSYELFNASAFAAQGKGARFAETQQSERQELFAEFLGLQRYAEMAKTAGAARTLATAARDRVLALISGLAAAADPALLNTWNLRDLSLEETTTTTRARQTELRARIDELKAQLAVADDGAAMTAAQARVSTLMDSLAAERAGLAQAIAAIASEQSRGTTEVATLERDRTTQIEDIDKRVAGNTQLLDQAAAIRAAVAALADGDKELVRRQADLATASSTRDAASIALTAAERALHAFVTPQAILERAKSDSALLTTVPCGGAGAFAACQFLVNAAAAAARIAELETAVAGVAEAVITRDVAQRQLREAEASFADLQAGLVAFYHSRTTHQEKAKYAEPLAAAEARLEELQTKRAEITAQTDRLIADARGRLAARLAELETERRDVEARVTQLTADLAQAEAALRDAGNRFSRTHQLQQDLRGRETAWDETVTTLATIEAERADLGRRRVEHAAAVARVQALETRLMGINAELLEWDTLAKAFGRSGLPDLEIDAAGPTISATANQILSVCYGARFTLELVTQVENASGGMKSEFTVRVWDNEAASGEWHDIGDLSGGEKVIVSEALMNAISLYVNQRSAHPIRTLWRDETGSALDPENAVRYITMLRKVRELGNIHHVFFISHNAAAAALADVQIKVDDGTARIVLPPFSEAA